MLTFFTEPPPFRRVVVPQPVAPKLEDTKDTSIGLAGVNCQACRKFHLVGSCPVKLAGVEYCNLCGMAHYGHARVCPHIQSETQVYSFLLCP
jgi:hypothetical protein